MTPENKRRFRISITISFLFTFLLIVFGLIFRQVVYYQSSKIVTSSSHQYFSQIYQELSLQYRSSKKTVSQTIHIIGASGIMQADTLQARIDFLSLFQAALAEEPQLSGLQIGYESGDYFIVRPLNNKYVRKTFASPEDARFVVDNISESEDNDRSLQRIFYTDKLKEISRNQPIHTEYDPRNRPWYKDAQLVDHEIDSAPYFFHFIKQMGITVSYKPAQTSSVIGGDISLFHLSESIAKYPISSRSELVLLEKNGGQFLVTAYKDPEKLFIKSGERKTRANVTNLGSPVLNHVVEDSNFLTPFHSFVFNEESWLGSAHKLDVQADHDFYLVMLSPEKDILADARKLQQQTLQYTAMMILLAIPFIWFLARKISTPLQELAAETKRISNFEFKPDPSFHGSTIKEVDELGHAIATMEWTIGQFISLIHSLANEQDFEKLLQTISEETMKVAEAEAVFTYIMSDTENCLKPESISLKENINFSINNLPQFGATDDQPLLHILQHGKRVTEPLETLLPGVCLPTSKNIQFPTVVVFPLRTRAKEGIGLLCLVYDAVEIQKSEKFRGRLTFLDAFAGFAAVTLESRKMLLMQKQLLESFIKVLADAIDSKSPYTGGHCQRVPVLAKLLAQKACESQTPPFDTFNLKKEEWEALHIGSWLHDCGKVTTPEYIVDKATKLETIYNRIHEIRMRFELLKQDAHIKALKQALGCELPEMISEELNQIWQQLDQEYAFVGQCNVGSEFMAPEHTKTLETIAKRTWTRTLSDRIGISWEELQRKERREGRSLPATEYLLADLDEHLILRESTDRVDSDNTFGFKIETPEYKYNRGELYNLSIVRGTLTDEDRYTINDHIVQTIMMLKQLPFPKHLQEVPEIAGGHHEKIDGTGYPRKLKGKQMSTTSKMMVIADIFEALTASDRPYKKAKKLSEVIRIMGFMVKDQHIDADLFILFLSSGAYLEYAQTYLQQEQIDSVDIELYCSNRL